MHNNLHSSDSFSIFMFMKYLAGETVEQKKKFRDECMGTAKSLFDAVENFEKHRNVPAVANILTAALWPTNVWTREALVGAWEHDWEEFAPQTQEDLEAVSRGFGVKPIEDFHRSLNTQARHNQNGFLGRTARWFVAQRCDVLPDMERRQAKPNTDDMKQARSEQLNAAMFELSAKKFSLGEDTYKDLLNKKDDRL